MIRKTTLFFLAIFTLFLLSGSFGKISAGWTCVTAGGHCTDGCYSQCTCDGNNCNPNQCPGTNNVCYADPGYYVCNSGQCAIEIPPNGVDPDGDVTGPSCTATAPSNLNSTRPSATSSTLSWTPGLNGGYQALWVSTNPNPYDGCAGSAGGTATCPVRLDWSTTVLQPDASSYVINNLLAPNTVYFWRVMNFQSNTCYISSDATHLTSCSLYPNPQSVAQGLTTTVSSTISSSAGVNGVVFTSQAPTVFSATSPILSLPYQTVVRGLAPGTGSLTASVSLTNNATPVDCTPSTINVVPPPSWWQVRDSDVQSNTYLSSLVPFGNFFGLPGTGGGFPGVPAYGTTTNLTSTNASENYQWLANSPWSSPKTFDYAYFSSQIPDDITPTPLGPSPLATDITSGGTFKYGYYWYKFDGLLNPGQDLTLPAINISSISTDRKVILLVSNANLQITGNITLDDGHGFFMAIVNGNITVNPLVGGGTEPNLEGIYVADGEFQTGLANSQLWVRGSVVGYGGTKGVNMQRDLGISTNSTKPSELFEYAPDQILLFPSTLGVRKINWKEVAP